jgi:hypothetical protein
MKVKINDKRTVKSKEIGNEIEFPDNLKLSCELTVYDAHSGLIINRNYLIKLEFNDIVSIMGSYGYEFQGLYWVQDAIAFIFFKTEKHENLTM